MCTCGDCARAGVRAVSLHAISTRPTQRTGCLADDTTRLQLCRCEALQLVPSPWPLFPLSSVLTVPLRRCCSPPPPSTVDLFRWSASSVCLPPLVPCRVSLGHCAACAIVDVSRPACASSHWSRRAPRTTSTSTSSSSNSSSRIALRRSQIRRRRTAARQPQEKHQDRSVAGPASEGREGASTLHANPSPPAAHILPLLMCAGTNGSPAANKGIIGMQQQRQ